MGSYKDVKIHVKESCHFNPTFRTFSDKPNDDLFQIDVAYPAKKPRLSEMKKRKANALKPLKGFAALENTSKVQDPIVKRY